MAGEPTSDAGLLGLYKTYYTDKELQNLLFRDSPFVMKVNKIRVTGKTYNYAMLYGRGGAVSGDATAAAAVAATTAKIAEAATPIGKIFSVFNITNLEKMASGNARGAYAPAAIAKMFAACEGARKTLASAAYGSGYGELAKVSGAVLAGASSMVVTSTIGFEVGTRFDVVDGASTSYLPSHSLKSGGPFTVTAIDDSTKTITFSPVAPSGGFADTAWIELYGSRDGSGNPLLPEGLGALIPAFFDRTGASWTSYIGTAFHGITRSLSVTRLAGNFYAQQAGEKIATALIAGIRLCRRQGGVPDLIIMNDEDLADLHTELNTQTNYMQMINTGDRKNKNDVTKGIQDVSYVFSTSYLGLTLDDPFCPKGYAYILDTKAIDLVTISDAEKVTQSSVAAGEPGSASVLEAKDVTDQPFQLNLEDYVTINPATLVADGAGAQVLISLFMNFALYNPAHCAVVKISGLST